MCGGVSCQSGRDEQYYDGGQAVRPKEGEDDPSVTFDGSYIML